MMDISRVVETVVIDEIQMIGDESRGWAWTRCLLGAPASVVHVCGSPSALQIVQRILDQTGFFIIFFLNFFFHFYFLFCFEEIYFFFYFFSHRRRT